MEAKRGIYNLTRKSSIADVCEQVNPWLGLMFQTPRPVWFSFRTPRRIGLHNIFVPAPIDVLFVLGGKVVEIKRSFKPYTFYTPTEKATHVIELPAGMAKNVRVGDKLVLK